jgi:Tfp pilus assembly protein PilF
MTAATNDRMRQLQQMLQREPDDPFLLYGLAMEYKKADDGARAAEYLDRVITQDPGYCYAYYQKGQIQESLGELDAARQTYQLGVEAAKKKGDAHAQGEIEAALSMIG